MNLVMVSLHDMGKYHPSSGNAIFIETHMEYDMYYSVTKNFLIICVINFKENYREIHI